MSMQTSGAVNTIEIQQQGAMARSRGEHMVANPFYKARNMPISTGEPTEQWNQKAVAWRRGWEQENFQQDE